MSEYQEGRKAVQIVWPDDRYMKVGEDNCTGIQVSMEPCAGGMEAWLTGAFKDGSTVSVNPRMLAMVDWL